MNEKYICQITKQRWDRLLLPLIAMSTVIGAGVGTWIGHWNLLVLPVFIGVLWGWLRYQTPEAGMAAVRIDGNPRVISLLLWLGFILCLATAWSLFDTLVLGKSFFAPLESREIGMFIALVGILLAGVYVIERRRR